MSDGPTMTGQDRTASRRTPFPGWTPDEETLALWPLLAPGQAVTIVKWNPAGEEVTRYDGSVRRVHSAGQWIEASATWTHREVALAGLRFVPGDSILEYFSPVMPFNVFAVFAPGDRLRGWYANVTYPAFLRENGDKLELIWHDLYLDLIGLPDGHHVTLDEDELDDSGLRMRDRDLYERIKRTEAAVAARFVAGDFPFSVTSLNQSDD